MPKVKIFKKVMVNRHQRLPPGFNDPTRIDPDQTSNFADDDSSSFGDTQENVGRNHQNKIQRWVSMMRNSDDINAKFVEILAEIENDILNQLDVFQKNLVQLIESKFGSLINRNGFKVYTSTYIRELQNLIGVELPTSNLEAFESLEKSLEDLEKRNALRNILLCVIDGEKGLNSDIAAILNAVTTLSVLQEFSGTGKLFKGQKKKDFSATNIFECMEDVLTDKYKQSSEELKILSRVCRRISFVVANYKGKKNNVREDKSVSDLDD